MTDPSNAAVKEPLPPEALVMQLSMGVFVSQAPKRPIALLQIRRIIEATKV